MPEPTYSARCHTFDGNGEILETLPLPLFVAPQDDSLTQVPPEHRVILSLLAHREATLWSSEFSLGLALSHSGRVLRVFPQSQALDFETTEDGTVVFNDQWSDKFQHPVPSVMSMIQGTATPLLILNPRESLLIAPQRCWRFHYDARHRGICFNPLTVSGSTLPFTTQARSRIHENVVEIRAR